MKENIESAKHSATSHHKEALKEKPSHKPQESEQLEDSNTRLLQTL